MEEVGEVAPPVSARSLLISASASGRRNQCRLLRHLQERAGQLPLDAARSGDGHGTRFGAAGVGADLRLRLPGLHIHSVGSRHDAQVRTGDVPWRQKEI